MIEAIKVTSVRRPPLVRLHKLFTPATTLTYSALIRFPPSKDVALSCGIKLRQLLPYMSFTSRLTAPISRRTQNPLPTLVPPKASSPVTL